MKKLLAIFSLLICLTTVAQNSFPSIDNIEIKDKIIEASIDKYPITIYLQFGNYSNYHVGIYSVKGWYYYNNIKTNIPLVGVYAGNELTLYQFKDEKLSEEVLHFSEMKNNYREELDYYKNLSNYNEKFTLTESKKQWTNNKKTLDVFTSEKDFRIKKSHEFLKLDNKTSFNLHDLGKWNYNWNFKILSRTNGRFVLSYQHGSSLNAMGMCGAGRESGLVYLEFDNSNTLVSYKIHETENCLNSIATDEVLSTNKDIRYTVSNYGAKNIYIVIVNLETSEIKTIDY